MSDCLYTERLALRPLEREDAPVLAPLLNDFEVAKNLVPVRHPYGLSDALEFIGKVEKSRGFRESFVFAITRKSDKAFLGVWGLELGRGAFHVGYWLGRPYWGQGYATEAGRAGIAFAFAELLVGSLASGWFFDNPASGNVLSKLGFTPDGADERNCLSRGTKVLCHKMVLAREAYERGKDSR
jgi:RimJ/RimL family protein N-acetyltransferase